MGISKKTDEKLSAPFKSTNATSGHKKCPLSKSSNDFFLHAYQMAPHEFIQAVRMGTPIKDIVVVEKALGLPNGRYIEMIGLIRPTFNRKMKTGEALEPDQSERHMRVMRMVGQLVRLVNEFGNPDGLDVALWFGAWIEQPNPALGNAKPSEYLDTAMGAEVVEATLHKIFTGAYV